MSPRASANVLTIEALVLVYPTFLGALMILGAILPALTGAHARGDLMNALAGLIILIGLVSGWRLLIGFLISGAAHTRRARYWWYAATIVAVLATLSFAFRPTGEPLGYGVLFLPSYAHLCAEVWLRAI
jgi:hypothetical protein